MGLRVYACAYYYTFIGHEEGMRLLYNNEATTRQTRGGGQPANAPMSLKRHYLSPASLV